ncbi:MAG: tRNA pseudouridine(54/55) synthase Pus10 [Thermoplasmata archaeon]|nr:MAG: tRNA pseudouridine(54/55) synthase Pus10 [Thermoplasmata archaeon]
MSKELKDKKILGLADRIIHEYQLCDACLGRMFAKIEHGLTNRQRGALLRRYLGHTDRIDAMDCWLCQGLLNEINDFTELTRDTLKEYEFDTFLIGSKIDEEILEKEKKLWDIFGGEYAESIKMEINREIGKKLSTLLDKPVDFKNPVITAVIDTAFNVVELQIKPLFIYGRYKKYVRGIPQTKWFCRTCRGKGCKQCSYTGKMYNTSVEELIAKKTLELTNGADETFHGSGREDIDARMLGNGRPFVLEIKNPRKRNIDLSYLEKQINIHGRGKIEVSDLRFADKEDVVRLKKADFIKKYRVTITAEKHLHIEKLKEAAQILHGSNIHQLTPSRVVHRRANKIRTKKILNCEVESVSNKTATLIIETESGTYVKELISGDNGRTKPNISDLIGVPCRVTELDVIEIKGE